MYKVDVFILIGINYGTHVIWRYQSTVYCVVRRSQNKNMKKQKN